MSNVGGNVAYLMQQQMMMRGQAFAPGVPFSPLNPFQNVPIPGGAAGSAAFQLAIQPHLQKYMLANGHLPMSVFERMNPYDIQHNMAFQNIQQQILTQAAKYDQMSIERTLGGLNRAMGLGMGATTINSLSGIAASAAPIMALAAPDFLESLMGRQGSATVLANNLYNAGRYQLDPITGQAGFSRQTVDQMTNTFMKMMNLPGNFGGIKSFTAGQTGVLFDELARRGFMGTRGTETGRTLNDVQDAYNHIRGVAPGVAKMIFDQQLGGLDQGKFLTNGAINALGAERIGEHPDIQRYLRQGTFERAKKTLKEQADALSAMRDLFGANGEPNAPVPELIRALDELVGGMKGVADPARIAQTVRSLQSIGQMSGVSLPQMQAMNLQTQAMLARSGGDLSFAPGMVASNLAYVTTLMQRGTTSGWGASSIAQLSTLDMAKRDGARQSALANELATLMEISLGEERGIKDPKMAAVIHGIETGDLSRMNLLPGDVRRIAANAGFGDEFDSLVRLRKHNQQHIARYGIQDTVREGAGVQQANRNFQSILSASWRNSPVFKDLDMSPKETVAAMDALSKTAIDAVMNANPDVLADRDKFEQVITKAIEGRLKRGGPEVEELRRRISDPNFDGGIRDLAKELIPRMENGAPDGLRTFYDTNSPRHMQHVRQVRHVARVEGEFRERMTGVLGQGNMSDLVTSLQNFKGNDFASLIARSFGGVPMADINKELMPKFAELRDKQQEIIAIEQQLLNGNLPAEQKQALQKKLSRLKEEQTTLAGGLRVFGDAGIIAVSTSELRDVHKAGEEFSSLSKEISLSGAGMRDGLFWGLLGDVEMTPEERMRWLRSKSVESDKFVSAVEDEHSSAAKYIQLLRKDDQLYRALGDEGRERLSEMSKAQQGIESLQNMTGASFSSLRLGAVEFNQELGRHFGAKSQEELSQILAKQTGDLVEQRQTAFEALSKKVGRMGRGGSGLSLVHERSVISWAERDRRLRDLQAAAGVTRVIRKEDGTIVALVEKDGKKVEVPLDEKEVLMQQEYGINKHAAGLKHAFEDREETDTKLIANIAKTTGKTKRDLHNIGRQLDAENQQILSLQDPEESGDLLTAVAAREFGWDPKNDRVRKAFERLGEDDLRSAYGSQRKLEFLTSKYLRSTGQFRDDMTQSQMQAHLTALGEKIGRGEKNLGLNGNEREIFTGAIHNPAWQQLSRLYDRVRDSGDRPALASRVVEEKPVKVELPEGMTIQGTLKLESDGAVLRASTVGGVAAAGG